MRHLLPRDFDDLHGNYEDSYQTMRSVPQGTPRIFFRAYFFNEI